MSSIAFVVKQSARRQHAWRQLSRRHDCRRRNNSSSCTVVRGSISSQNNNLLNGNNNNNKNSRKQPMLLEVSGGTRYGKTTAAAWRWSSSSTADPEQMAADVAQHREGLEDPDVPEFQNPLHHQQNTNGEPEKIFREDFDTPEDMEAAVVPAPPLEDADGQVMCPAYLAEMADEIVHLNMLEMNELVNKLADHFGFDDKMLSPDDGADDGDGDVVVGDADGNAAAAEAKTAFDIRLTGFDAKSKIKVIKEVRSIAGLGLKEAKEVVEGAPNTILKGVKQEQADEIKAKLEELGATVEIV